MTPEKMRALEWAATYLKTGEKRRGCRCAGSCESCRAWRDAERKLTPDAVLELIAEAKGSDVYVTIVRLRAFLDAAPMSGAGSATDLLGVLFNDRCRACFAVEPCHCENDE